MSLDWPLLALVAVGQTAIFVYVINVVHGLGLSERRLDWVKLVLLAAMIGSTGFVALSALHGGWSRWSLPFRVYALVCVAVAALGLPGTALGRVLRRKPGGIVERSEESDLTAAPGGDALIGPGRHAWLLRLPGNESFRLRKREWEVTHPGLPDAWDGLTVVQLTDLHFAPCFQPRFFELVVEEAAAWEADLVLFTGDLVDHDDSLGWIVPLLSRIRGGLGTFGILGNHDYVHHPANVASHLERAGFTILEGKWQRLEIEGMTLGLGGTSYPWGPALDLAGMPDADFRIVLSHSPDLFSRAARAGVDLMLSGHNHGGQVRVPLVGPVFMPSVYSRRFDRGFFHARKTLLHVSQGVAGKHPIRYGCVPEIGRFILRTGREPSPHAVLPRARQRSHARGPARFS